MNKGFYGIPKNRTYEAPLSASYATTASYAMSAGGASVNTLGTTLYSIDPQAGPSFNQNYSIVLGYLAGNGAISADNVNFLGSSAGAGATNAQYSNFLGYFAGQNATNAANSNFLGQNAGFSATNANNSNFFGQTAGRNATSASYSTLIGYQAGYNVAGGALGIKSNNIIIGTNITLPNGALNSINLGGIIFATGSYSTTTGNPFSGSVGNGKIGINVVSPNYNLDVSGSGNYTNGLTVTGSLNAPSITGSLFGTASWANNAQTASFLPIATYNITSSWANNSITASYILNAVSASYAATASFAPSYVLTSITSSMTVATASWATNAQTSSYVNALRQNVQITGSLLVTGSITVTSGSVITPNLPAFRVVGTSSTDITATTILSGSAASVDYNQGNYYNNTTGLFTAPLAGLYQVFLNARVGSVNAQMQAIVYKNTNIVQLMWEAPGLAASTHFGVSGIVKLAVNDTLQVTVAVGKIQFDGNDSWGVAYIG